MNTFRRIKPWLGPATLLLVLVPGARGADAPGVRILSTPSGVRFGLLGDKGAAPAPTLFVFANAIEETLGNDDYNKAGRLLADKGYLCVALDLPCHGKEEKPGEPAGLGGWAARLAKGEDPVPGFLKNASAVLDFLIAEHYTDPKRVAAGGTSRGGFMALHFAAGEPRVKCVAAFAPVTDLTALREFAPLKDQAATRALALVNRADPLAARPVWLCIGNHDERVGTDLAIAFTRKLVAAAVSRNKPAAVELHVMPVAGHTIHKTAHDEVAAWVAGQLANPAK
jgi:dienelactone hydrolase